jgi:hypothetical protein
MNTSLLAQTESEDLVVLCDSNQYAEPKWVSFDAVPK